MNIRSRLSIALYGHFPSAHWWNTLQQMAQTPTQTKAKSTHRATWHDKLAAVVVPLTKQRKNKVRAVMSRRQASQFLRDWPRICEIAWWYAHDQHASATSQSDTPEARRTRKKALTAALKALDDSAHCIDRYVARWDPIRRSYFPFNNHNTPEAFAHAVKGFMKAQRERVQWFLSRLGVRPARPAKKGRPITARFYLLTMILAYFRHHQWDDAIPLTSWSSDRYRVHPESLFVQTAWAVVVPRTLSAAARRALKDSTLVWATLNDHAPHLSPEQRSRRARTNPLGQRSRRKAETAPFYDPLFKPTGDISRFFTITTSKQLSGL